MAEKMVSCRTCKGTGKVTGPSTLPKEKKTMKSNAKVGSAQYRMNGNVTYDGPKDDSPRSKPTKKK